jgi:hypothetical protein
VKYRIELAGIAKADIRGQALWVRENVTRTAATKWLDGLYKAIDTLQTIRLEMYMRGYESGGGRHREDAGSQS